MNRRRFMAKTLTSAAALSAGAMISNAQTSPTNALDKTTPSELVRRRGRQDLDLVFAFVRAGHNNLARVKEMVVSRPKIRYCSLGLGGRRLGNSHWWRVARWPARYCAIPALTRRAYRQLLRGNAGRARCDACIVKNQSFDRDHERAAWLYTSLSCCDQWRRRGRRSAKTAFGTKRERL